MPSSPLPWSLWPPQPFIQLSSQQQQQIEAYYALLVEANKNLNLTRIQSPEAFMTRHLIDGLSASLVFEQLKCSPSSLMDVGTGAGVPGVLLAIVYPDCQVTCLDSVGKKIQFIQSVQTELGLNNLNAIVGRAEELSHQPEHRQAYHVVTARAVTALPALLEVILPLTQVEGVALAYKTTQAFADEIPNAAGALHRLKANCVAELQPQLSEDTANHLLLAYQQMALIAKDYPRRWAQIEKKAL